jgi:hypothetical protein
MTNMKVGDLVKFAAAPPRWKGDNISKGIIVAELSGDSIVAPAVSVLWSSGELVERVPPRILEVISGSW